MASNNNPVTIPMIGRNPSDHPGMDTSDPNTLTGEAVLSFHNISYRETVQSGFAFCKKTSVIERLSNMNGIMKPGLNAIMGPQDGSRSLLLDVLAARKDPHGLSGDILINGKRRPANFTCTSGYVPQNDVVMRTVTVRDNIEFSAALRLPMTMTRDEKRRRINEVLELLCLDKVSNVKPRSKELRKRTSIAMELVTEHPILFLDDPTTGLDLSTSTDVISVLRRMSRGGRTIIFSISRPSYSIFRQFDSLTLVASGKIMFHGPAKEALEYFRSTGCNYVSHNNPADFFLDILNGGFSALFHTEEDGHEADEHKDLSERQHQVREKLANMYVQSSLYSEMRSELDPLLGEQNAGRSSALGEITCVTAFWHQLWWIICRSFKNIKDFIRISIIQVIIAVIAAMIVGTTFLALQNDCDEVQNRTIVLLLVAGFECITSLSSRELFMIDRDRFLHEHTSGYYRVSSYFLGKLLAELVPKRLLSSIIFTVIVFSMTGVRTDVKGFFTMIFTVMMLAFCVSSLPLFLGAGENTAAVPTQLIVIYFLITMMYVFSFLSQVLVCCLLPCLPAKMASYHSGDPRPKEHSLPQAVLIMVLCLSNWKYVSGLRVYPENLKPEFSWIQYLSIAHYGLTALLHNEFLGQHFCPEHKTAEISRCHNFVICTGEEFLRTQAIDLSSWGFWKNHVVLVCIMIILLSITYVQLLHLKRKRYFKILFNFQ